jgi:ferrochelatase
MTTAVITLNFGEPAEASADEVVPFLERIFRANASLEDFEDERALEARTRELAERRAPGLMEEYREIGGSPLNGQAERQSEALEDELRARGRDARVFTGMQFTEPFIRDAAEQAREEGAERVVALPVYPLCGASTTVAALRELAVAVAEMAWDVELEELSGWHRHPGYLDLRADAVVDVLEEEELDLDDPGTRLVFSAHGTPIRYLEEGNRYRAYVRDHCEAMADALGIDDWELGYQNHANRDVPWTRPDVEDVVETIEADRIVVDPVSFMHEQSETLAELDHDLREEAEARGLGFHRVPVPHDDERFPGVLADLVEAALGVGGRDLRLHRCRCRPTPATRCLNGPEVG